MRCGRGGGTGSPRFVNRMHAYITRAHTQTHANTHMYSSGTRDRAQIPPRRSDYHPRDITPAGCEQSWRAESQGKPSELVPTCRARSCPHILVPLYVHSCISIQCVRCTQCILTLSLNTQTHTRAPAMDVMPSGSEVCQLHRARCSPRVAASSKRSLRQ